MRVLFRHSRVTNGGSVTFYRDPDDPKFYGSAGAKGEHNLFHYFSKWLNKRGFSLIKKRMWKDGHLVDDIQPYLRCRNKNPKFPHLFIYSHFFALRGANEDWNKRGEVTLTWEGNIWADRQQETIGVIGRLAEKCPDIQVQWSKQDSDLIPAGA